MPPLDIKKLPAKAQKVISALGGLRTHAKRLRQHFKAIGWWCEHCGYVELPKLLQAEEPKILVEEGLL